MILFYSSNALRCTARVTLRPRRMPGSLIPAACSLQSVLRIHFLIDRLKLALKGERVLSVPCRFPAKEAAEAEEQRKRAIEAAKKAYEEHAKKRRQSMAAI